MEFWQFFNQYDLIDNSNFCSVWRVGKSVGNLENVSKVKNFGKEESFVFRLVFKLLKNRIFGERYIGGKD